MRTLVIVTAVLLAACGTDSVSLADYDSATRDAFCRHFAKCGLVESVETCNKVGPSVALPLSASKRAAVDMGKVHYSGENTTVCLDALAERSCDVTSQSGRTRPDECFEEFTGSAKGGEACALDEQCISQTCTRPTSCGMACCLGTCTGDTAPGHAKLGESCENARCDESSFCDIGTQMCVALKPPGGTCANIDECRYGLDCDRGMCVALPGPDQPCTSACRDEGTVCSDATKTCVKVGLAGAPCQSSQDCSPVYRCDATKHCGVGSPLGSQCLAGQPCAGERSFCQVPEGQLMGTCVAPQPNGAACRNDLNCESVHCDGASQMCAPQPVCT